MLHRAAFTTELEGSRPARRTVEMHGVSNVWFVNHFHIQVTA
jgi:hypothetical protein